jgi:type IV secretory pathway protease TraF
MGLHEVRSWDSRYFGPVPTHCILGQLSPLVTW